MKHFPRILLLNLLLVLLAGCHRMASVPTADLSRLTPQPGEEGALNGEAPGTSPDLDPAVQQALRIYPLGVGSSRVYHTLGFDPDQEVLWQVVETVINSKIEEGRYFAEVERVATLLEGDPGEDFPSVPAEGRVWYLVEGDKVYRLASGEEPDPAEAWLDLILPFPDADEVWFPHPEARVRTDITSDVIRTVSSPFERQLPFGGMYTCYRLTTRYPQGVEEAVFCEGVGYVYQLFNHNDDVIGLRSELVGFSLQ